MQKTPFIPVFTLRFLRALVITMRPYLMYVSGSAGVVGLAYAGQQGPGTLVLTFVPLFLSYGLGQALTDCFQTDTDALSSPYRPLVSGIVSARQIMAASFAGLAVTILMLVFVNPWIIIPGVLGVAGLLTYTPFKRTWWGGPPWNSWIVALLPVIGRMADRHYGLKELFDFGDRHDAAFLAAVVSVFFAYVNFVVIGYFKDISADRKTGYRTFPVVFGWQAAAFYSDLTALLACAAAASCLLIAGGAGVWPWVILTAGTAINAHAQAAIHRIRDENRAHGPIGNVVRAFVLYCLAMAVAARPGWLVPAGLFYACFEVTLRLRPERSQV
jgi:4-hydroxybenzoate polyprenyltransferase